MEYPFDHENLDVYTLALEVARACAALGMAAGRNHYRMAAGSAAEALAQQPKLRREGAMLRGLTRKRRPSRRVLPGRLRSCEETGQSPNRPWSKKWTTLSTTRGESRSTLWCIGITRNSTASS